MEQVLEQVDIEPGQTYRCRVRGHAVILQVLAERHHGAETAFSSDELTPESAWTDFPPLAPRGIVRSREVAPSLPDVPEIPEEDGR